jgi:hypothetical protein
MESNIVAEFPKCYSCGSLDKVSEMGCAPSKATGKIAVDAFTILEQKITPIEQPVMAGVMVQAIIHSYDVCGNCGAPRCTRVELKALPVQMQGGMPPAGGNHRGGMPPPFMGRG